MRHGEAAMVADELAAEAMIDQPGRAVGAGEAEAAGAAQRERRVAAAIEKQQRLLAALQRGLHRAGQHRRNVMPRRRRFAAQIDRLDGDGADAYRHVAAGQPGSDLVGLPVDCVTERLVRHLEPPHGFLGSLRLPARR